MKKIGLILFYIAFISACSSNHKIDSLESFCDCFERHESKEFNERSSLCNPDSTNEALDLNLIKQNLESCSSFYEAVIFVQEEQLILRSQNDIPTSSGKWEKIHQNVINQEFDSLIVNCSDYLLVDSLNTDALFLRGFGLEKLERFAEAIEVYKKINRIKNTDQWDMSITIAEIKKKKRG